MGLLQDWRDTAYSQKTDKKVLQKFWTDYFMVEKGIYEKLLSEPDVKVKGTVKELAEKYEIPVMTMVGFLDGIDESLIVPNPLEEMDENTEVNLIFDKEKLYKNMVDAKADWLYGLPMWDAIFDEEKKKGIWTVQRARHGKGQSGENFILGERSDCIHIARCRACVRHGICKARRACHDICHKRGE